MTDQPRQPFEPSDVDWDAIERAYRAGGLSNRAIAAEHGITESAIRQRAKKDGWVKGDPHAIRGMAMAKANIKTIPKLIEPDADYMEEVAEEASNVLVRHRRMAGVMAGLLKDMAAQLRTQNDTEPDLAGAIEDFFMAKAAQNPLLAGVYKQQCNAALHAIGLNNRSKTMLNLSNAMAKLVDIERVSWSLNDNSDNRSYEDLLAELHAKHAASNDDDNAAAAAA